MKDISMGQFYPARSPIHRLDPRTKILMVIIFIVMAIGFTSSFVSYGIIALTVLIGILFSRIPITKVLKSVRAVIFLLVFTFIFTLFFYSAKEGDTLLVEWGIIKIYLEGIYSAIKLALRLFLIIMGPTLLTLTTTPMDLTDGLESLLKPLKLIKFPVHELTLIMSIALRFIPSLSEETEKIMNAQKARCADFDSGNLIKKAKALLPVLIPLFVSAFRRADELADAMDSRCYRGAKGRTKLKILKFHFRDLVAMVLLLAFFFVVLLLKYNWFGIAFIGALV